MKSYLHEKFPYGRPLSEEGLMQGVIDGRLFGYVPCDIELPEHLRNYFSNFPPFFKITVVGRDDIDNLLKQYAEKENIIVQPRRMLFISFILTNGTITTALLLFYLKLGLVSENIHRLFQYTPTKRFDIFVQSAMDAWRQGEENPNTSVVGETMKLLANSFFWLSDYGSQSSHSDKVSDR